MERHDITQEGENTRITAENAREMQSKSVESRRKKRTLREKAVARGEHLITDPKIKDALRKLGYTDEELTIDGALLGRLERDAINGNMKAMQLLLNLRGELVSKTESEVSINGTQLSVDEAKKLFEIGSN